MPPGRFLILLVAVVAAAGLTVALIALLADGLRLWLVPAFLITALAVRVLARRG